MLIGVPKEIKTREFRVGLVPSSVAELVRRGHEVLIERHKLAQELGQMMMSILLSVPQSPRAPRMCLPKQI